ncbi:HupE/UreJ family protein [Telluria mixta]|uniref:HupE/UreJ family protein n=1 Tax=Telluria mixta TaxID=34071 RepID=UPI002479E8DF|nr:HupE/UreJ family protein [Telluria mixta]WEM95711.1 HupE/UreJ family protein [Telluria mixta]
MGPIFPRREGWIAGGFGLVHGLAFASALRDLHLEGTRLAAGILAFNLGVEAVQAMLVLLAAPLLVLLARTDYFARVRQATAVVAAAMALAWIGVRAAGMAIPGFA